MHTAPHRKLNNAVCLAITLDQHIGSCQEKDSEHTHTCMHTHTNCFNHFYSLKKILHPCGFDVKWCKNQENLPDSQYKQLKNTWEFIPSTNSWVKESALRVLICQDNLCMLPQWNKGWRSIRLAILTIQIILAAFSLPWMLNGQDAMNTRFYANKSQQYTQFHPKWLWTLWDNWRRSFCFLTPQDFEVRSR